MPSHQGVELFEKDWGVSLEVVFEVSETHVRPRELRLQIRMKFSVPTCSVSPWQVYSVTGRRAYVFGILVHPEDQLRHPASWIERCWIVGPPVGW